MKMESYKKRKLANPATTYGPYSVYHEYYYASKEGNKTEEGGLRCLKIRDMNEYGLRIACKKLKIN